MKEPRQQALLESTSPEAARRSDAFVNTPSLGNPNSPSTGPPLLADFDDEPTTARNMGVSIQTLMGWRKKGLAPEHIVVARKIYYSRDAQREWVLSGGTRGAIERLGARYRPRPQQQPPQPGRKRGRPRKDAAASAPA